MRLIDDRRFPHSVSRACHMTPAAKIISLARLEFEADSIPFTWHAVAHVLAGVLARIRPDLAAESVTQLPRASKDAVDEKH